MQITRTELEGVLLVHPELFRDHRGYFMESYHRGGYHEAGIRGEFVQDNRSFSIRGALRGLHYQLMPGQAKLVQAIHGEVFDVVVDLRRGSPTFGHWRGFRLTAETKVQLYIPIGFAHGFCALSETAEVQYKVDCYYDPARERGIRYDDLELAIDWPLAVSPPILSAKDQALPAFAEAEFDFVYVAQA